MTETPHPGRMSPNTGICFLLLGISTSMYILIDRKWIKFLSSIFILMVAILGIFSLFGYLVNLKFIFSWGNLSAMAVHTSLGFTLLSLGSFRIFSFELKEQKFLQSQLFPVFICAFGFSLFLISCQLLIRINDDRIKSNIQKDTQFSALEVTQTLKNKLNSMSQLFSEMLWLENYNLRILKNTIDSYFDHDPNLYVITSNFSKDNQKFYLRYKTTLNDAKSYAKRCYEAIKKQSHPHQINAIIDKNLYCIYEPNQQLLAIYDIKTIFDHIFQSELLNQYNVLLKLGNKNYFQIKHKNETANAFYIYNWGATAPVTLLNQTWQLQLWHNQYQVRTLSSYFPIIYLFLGIIISILLVISIQNWQKSIQHVIDLEKSNKELENFIYVASHDLKEPLRGIHNYAGFVIEDYQDKLDDQGKNQLTTLKKLSQRMESIINNLLEFSNLGRANLRIREVNFNEIILDVQNSLEPYFNKNHVKIEILKKLPTVPCDQSKISDVIYHIMLNGIKYNDNQNKLIQIDYSEHNESYTFSFKDNGIGIQPQYKSKIFELFKRLHKRDAFGGGSGVGLTIAKRIIERHQGQIWFESEIAKGSIFYFTLPKIAKIDNKEN